MTQVAIRVAKMFALLLLFMAGEAAAATCTSAQSGNWNTNSTWNCTGGTNRPGAGDTVIIVSPHTVTLDGNRSATNLQIDAGATLDDGNGRDLTLSGNAVINGTYDATGNNGNLTMTGNGVTLSGTGTIIDIKRIEIDGDVTIPATSNLKLTQDSEIRVGDNNTGTLTIDGTLDGTGMNNGTRLIRLDNNNTSNVIVNGTIDAPNSFIEVQSGGKVTNNGTVSLQYLDGDNSTNSAWVQGANSNLTLTKPAVKWRGTFDASAVGNTVTFNGTATPFDPATYYNIAGVGVTCPHPAGIIVLGTSPCTLPATPVAEYRMDEASWNGAANEVADSTVNALHGTALLGATTAAAKICNGANLSANYVEVADSPLLDISDSLTVAAWIKPSRWGGAAGKDALMTFLSKDTNYEAHIDSAGHVFWWWGTGSMTSTATIPIDSWSHVALVYANGSQTIYINGVASGTATFAGALPVNALPLQIGEDQGFGGGTRRFDGMIDEVKIFNAALTATQVSTGYANENAGSNWDGTARTCPSYGPDHIEVQHDGNGLTCSAETVTIRACVDAAVPCNTLYTAGGLSVILLPGGQSFAIDATGINSAASVQQSTATLPGSPVTLSAVSVPEATDATPTTCWNTATSTANCDMTFSDSGLVVTAPDHVSCNNASIAIEAVQTAPGTGRCVPAYQNVTRAVNLYTSYASPVTGTMAATASVDGGTNWFAVSAASPGTAQNLAFDATGKATILLNYQDAGRLTLNATGTAPTGKAMAGSGGFVVAPASFVFSGIPAAPLVAGQAFNATVTAMNACATPAATPNFTDQTVAITSSNPQPGLGNATAIDATLTATSGTGSVNLTWGEVGTIDLDASLSAYLGSALSISGAQAGVGGFRPAYFDTAVVPTATTPMPCPDGVACPAAFNGFIYSGQPFSVQVTARNLAGSTTANYDGTFGLSNNVTLTAWDALGSTTTPNPGPGVLASNAVAAADFAAGVATLATPTYTFAAATAPTNIFMRAIDTDSVSSLRAPAASSVEGGVAVASGRIKLSNAHGSELLPLPLVAAVQYFDGVSWLTSATDDVTSFNTNLSADGGNLAATIVTGLAGGVAVATPGIAPVVDGIRAFSLNPPGQVGSVNLTIDAPGYLLGNTARATFGVYKGNKEFIYLRENY